MEKIRIVICLIILLWNTPVFCSAQGSTQLKVGAERIEVVTRLLKDKRVGLVVNQTSCLGEQQQHLLDVLLERGIDVRCVFAPEHGFRGTADAGGTAITDRNKNVTEKPAEEKRVLPSEKETLETERAAREAEKKVYDTGKAEKTAIAGMEAGETGRTRKTVRKLAIALLAVIGTALLLLGVFVLLARICPDFIDSLLYSKEELEILNY